LCSVHSVVIRRIEKNRDHSNHVQIERVIWGPEKRAESLYNKVAWLHRSTSCN